MALLCMFPAAMWRVALQHPNLCTTGTDRPQHCRHCRTELSIYVRYTPVVNTAWCHTCVHGRYSACGHDAQLAFLAVVDVDDNSSAGLRKAWCSDCFVAALAPRRCGHMASILGPCQHGMARGRCSECASDISVWVRSASINTAEGQSSTGAGVDAMCNDCYRELPEAERKGSEYVQIVHVGVWSAIPPELLQVAVDAIDIHENCAHQCPPLPSRLRPCIWPHIECPFPGKGPNGFNKKGLVDELSKLSVVELTRAYNQYCSTEDAVMTEQQLMAVFACGTDSSALRKTLAEKVVEAAEGGSYVTFNMSPTPGANSKLYSFVEECRSDELPFQHLTIAHTVLGLLDLFTKGPRKYVSNNACVA